MSQQGAGVFVVCVSFTLVVHVCSGKSPALCFYYPYGFFSLVLFSFLFRLLFFLFYWKLMDLRVFANGNNSLWIYVSCCTLVRE